MQFMENKQNSVLVSLDALPKDILDKLKDYRFIQEERKEDAEVEDCFRSRSCDLPSTPKSRVSDYSPSTPRSKLSEDLVFKYPPSFQDLSENNGLKSPRKHLERVGHSPHSEPDHCQLFGENSDWMMAERLKPRTPPVSPDTSSRSSTCSFTEPQRHPVLNRSPESCFVCPSPSPRMDRYLQSPRLERNQQKLCLSPRNRLEHHDFLEKTPVKQVPGTQEPQLPGRSMTGSSHKTESNSDQLSPSFFAREMVNRSSPVRRIPDYPADYIDERRGVRKQLVFEGHPRRQEDLYYHREQYSPRLASTSTQRFDYEEADDLAERLRDPESTALLSQILGQLTKRKRKTSERSDCDCDCEDRSVKKRRSELKRQMNMNYLKQLETDVSVLNQQLRRSETRPENCSCAIMERQFLQMAENAYKNVRRHDASADGFAQFRKELTETNQILKDSLTVLNNMKEFCEHRSMVGLT